MKALFILNPDAGRNRRRRDLAILLEAHATRTGALLRTCARKEDLDGVIADAAAAECQVVFAVGGDGTVNEVGRRLLGTSLILGILPTGSGNGLARHLRISMHPPSVLKEIDASTAVDIDTAVVNGVPFLGTFGVGFDALVAHRFAQAGTRGLVTYMKEGVKAYFGYRPESYALEIDGAAHDETAFVLTVSNSNQYGNEARIAPLASLRDGLLDICSLRQAPLYEAPFIARRLFNGTMDKCTYLCLRQGREVVIRRKSEGPAHIDGEPMMLPAELHISILPRSLRVLVPNRAIDEI